VLLLLVPDEIMPEVYARDVAPQLRPGKLLDFAHGYNIAFGLIEPPPSVDVVLIAPRMIGAGVRDSYVSGEGYPSFVGVHQDATGKARRRMLGLAKALGTTRAGCLEMSMNDEATLDLFTEQAFGPAFGRVMMTAIQTLIDAGYPPEAVLLELYLSGELAYSFAKIRELGMVEQHLLHSHTSRYAAAPADAGDDRGDPLGRLRPRVVQRPRGEARAAGEGARDPGEATHDAMGGRNAPGLPHRHPRGEVGGQHRRVSGLY
jgi:ketol-acid reductoisomerase